jgi:DNA-binding XRE family transcriptional regulator
MSPFRESLCEGRLLKKDNHPIMKPSSAEKVSMTEREIVARLKTERQNLGYTQADIARLLMVPKSTIYRIENHKTNPLLASIVRYAEIVSLDIMVV